MTSALTPRDPVNDHLLTPQNCALLVIDYQPIQVTSVASRDRRELVNNIVAVARIAKLYKLPVVLSTVNVKTGINQPMITEVTDILPGEPIDRTTVNAGRTRTSMPPSRLPVATSYLFAHCGPRSASVSPYWTPSRKTTKSILSS